MLRYLYIVIVVGFFPSSTFSQSKKRNFRQHELGVLVGGSYYIGDLNTNGHFNLTQPAVGFFYRFSPNYRYSFRGGFNFGGIIGDDSQTNNADQIERNLNFKSQILEFNIMAEFNFLEYRITTEKYKFTTFLFLGLDVFTFKPKAQYNNLWINLQPLRTEGQSPYALTQIAIPFGIGVKLNVSKKVGIGIEWGPRKTFTDYLDDVSARYPDGNKTPFSSELAKKLSDRSINGGNNIDKQRGNPRTKDWYFFFGITLNFKLTLSSPPCHAYDH